MALVQKFNFRSTLAILIAGISVFAAACGNGAPSTGGPGKVDPNETAAKVNGKIITMEEVDRSVKQQAQGQESKFSPLELAGARLQVLQNLIEQEVMFQKAEKENLVPTDDEITVEINKRKVESRMSAEEFDKRMAEAGLTEKSFRDDIKKALAIAKLVDKVTGRIENPKDSEIEQFYKGNPEMFIKKRGVRLAAIVVDPADGGQGDTTRNQAEAEQRVKEVLAKVSQPASDFGALAREYSEDPSRLQNGDMGYLSEDDLKQNYPQLAAGFMNPQFTVGQITNALNISGRYYIFKLVERIEKDENLTLESPDVRPQIQQLLVENRKQLLAASYQAVAMNEAKIENFLAKKVVDNPNELSGARPAGSMNGESNSNAAGNSNVAANTSSNGNSNTGSNTAAASNSASTNAANSAEKK
ncbi:MAG: SurA N-terminal domain-containing protein [Acidobacteria bacterium]|nr:SurA N-terminal domain-containing protein [Acidobacteriota bacterium]